MIESEREIIYGKRPVRRTNRKPGQSEWYYLDPRGAKTFSDMKQIDVENENTPNPYASEIRNYLYNNDEYTYKALYGDEPPLQQMKSVDTSVEDTTHLNNLYNDFHINTQNGMFNGITDGLSVIADTIKYTPEGVWNTLNNLGELTADTKLAYDYWQKMKQSGNKLVGMYGSGQGVDIDNYYHPLLQCELAKISPISRDFGLRLGYAKEILDYHKKKGTMPMSVISTDSRKDLQNNLYGSNLGYYNPNKSCEDMLDDKRTFNMRKANIR